MISASYIYITDNLMVNNTGDGVFIDDSEKISIYNTSINGNYEGIYIDGSSDIYIAYSLSLQLHLRGI